jgi:hypothetical protein
VATLNFETHARDTQGIKFVWFHQRNNDRGAPVSDSVKIDTEIAIPSTAHGRVLPFSGTECNADPAAAHWRDKFGNLKGMRLAGLNYMWVYVHR